HAAAAVGSAPHRALPSFPTRRSSDLTKLRAAGAVVLGKTNLSEWANFRSTRSTSGWSSLGGQTRNPYALDRNPCGSSSGSLPIRDRKSTRLNSSHVEISYAVFCLKKK